jgi:hypothetical protein
MAAFAGPMVRIRLSPEVSQANFRIAPLAHPDPVERQPELLAHHLTAAKRAVTQPTLCVPVHTTEARKSIRF